jgi:alkanesulfonate monooxygenase SsuD/methylene tetrahydromethanopterin reductase-like flavin-dependent oxidoreductase (luciferase family)
LWAKARGSSSLLDRTKQSCNTPLRGVGSGNAYDESNLLIGTPDMIIERIQQGQRLCSFEEITLAARFGSMTSQQAEASLRLFAQEVLPSVREMDTPLHPSALPPAA